jgi:hypothetical protein
LCKNDAIPAAFVAEKRFFPRMSSALMLLLSALTSSTIAHNWVNSPSRSEFASTVNPALPSQTGLPHARVWRTKTCKSNG